MAYIAFLDIQNSENNNCERHEVNDQFGSFQLQYCNHRQPMKFLDETLAAYIAFLDETWAS